MAANMLDAELMAIILKFPEDGPETPLQHAVANEKRKRDRTGTPRVRYDRTPMHATRRERDGSPPRPAIAQP